LRAQCANQAGATAISYTFPGILYQNPERGKIYNIFYRPSSHTDHLAATLAPTLPCTGVDRQWHFLLLETQDKHSVTSPCASQLRRQQSPSLLRALKHPFSPFTPNGILFAASVGRAITA
jgi:hypothetical protein